MTPPCALEIAAIFFKSDRLRLTMEIAMYQSVRHAESFEQFAFMI